MYRFSLKRASLLLAVAALLSVSPAFAKDPDDADAKRPSKPRPAVGNTSPEDASIPHCFAKLNLSQKQQDQVKAVSSKFDGQLIAVWKQFSDRYLETVGMEASMLAAIEDTLDDAQRKHVRDQRRKVALAEKAEKSTGTKPKAAPTEPTAVVNEEIVIVGVSLSPDQEASADKIHGNYFSHLAGLKREIQHLHARLVSLEAEKIVELEKVLTEEQLKQLRDVRKSNPAPRVAAGKNEAPKE